MGKFTGFLICSDIDGTFSVDSKTISRNIDAVKYFTKNGGKFSIATGRTAAYLKNLDFFDCINAPSCLCNGSIVYDFEKEKIIRQANENFTLSEFLEAINPVIESLEGLYVYYTPQTIQAPNSIGFSFNDEELSSKPIKVVCTFDTEKKAMAFKNHCLSHSLFGTTYISNSWNTGVEFNSIDATKGSAIRFIKEYLPQIHTSVAIGDYENDIPMLKEADISACVGSGTDDAKKSADIIVKNAADGAVADLVEIIESRFIGQQ